MDCNTSVSSTADNCSSCAVYCSQAKHVCEHQKKHGVIHRAQNQSDDDPYKIVQDDKFGRYMVASRNLKAGDIIFEKKKALAVGPKQGTRPVCLSCYSDLDNDCFRCSSCNFPFCHEQCAKNRVHEAECKILNRAKQCITITDFVKPHPVYECITPLRHLLLKKTQPNDYKLFIELQNHNEERRGTDLWRVNQVNVVNFLRNVCRLADEFSEEEIHTACGVMDVNGFEIRIKSCQSIVGVFPTAAMMAHNCISNMTHVIDSNFQMTVRASVSIQRGEPIFMNYASSLEGTLERRAALRYSKFFDCDCSRCSDPTECLTYLSAFRCQKCPSGSVLPKRPLDQIESDWFCDHCDYKLMSAVITRMLKKMKEEFDWIGSNQIDRFEAFLSRHAHLLHTNHWLFTSARHSLSELYGHDERYLLGILSPDQLQRKTDICQSLIAVLDVVEPGLTRIRGVTLYEMHAPILLLARRQYEAGQCSIDQLKEKVNQVRILLSEAVQILSLEDPTSREGIMGTAAAQALDQMQRWIISI